MEANLVQRSGYRFTAIPSAGLHGVGVKALPGNSVRLVKGYLAARKVIREFKPDVLFLTGGYVSIPVAAAGRTIPSLLFMPDIEPGLAVKVIARFAARIAVPTADSCRFFSNASKVVVTGYPTRAELSQSDQPDVQQKFGLSSDKQVVMIFGGSQGAQTMNRALYPLLPDLLKRFQIIHLCGQNNWAENEAETKVLPADLAAAYHPFPYLHEQDLAAAFQAADLVVSRSGAAVLGEFPQFGLPAILVPYPFAWRYQYVNARYLEQHGAAIVLRNEEMKSSLCTILFDLFDHPERLHGMKAAMRSLATPQASMRLAGMLEDLAGQPAPTHTGGQQ